jgi:hypothetical protein
VPNPGEPEEGQGRWVYPVMEGIERGDKASVAVGIDFIEEDAHFPFGKTLKSNTARFAPSFVNTGASWTHLKPCDQPAIGGTDSS